MKACCKFKNVITMESFKEQFFLRQKGLIVRISKQRIIRIETFAGGTKIFTDTNHYVTRISLTGLQKYFGDNFFRIRRDIVIHLKRVRYVDLESNQVIMDDGTFYLIAKRRKKYFYKIIQKYAITNLM